MEATIKFDQDEVVVMCEQRCSAMYGVPEGMTWKGYWKIYEGIKVELVKDVGRPLVSPPAPVPVSANSVSTEDEVPF